MNTLLTRNWVLLVLVCTSVAIAVFLAFAPKQARVPSLWAHTTTQLQLANLALNDELEGKAVQKRDFRNERARQLPEIEGEAQFDTLVPGMTGLDDPEAFLSGKKLRDLNLMQVRVSSWQDTAIPNAMRSRDLSKEWSDDRQRIKETIDMELAGLRCWSAARTQERPLRNWSCLGEMQDGNWVRISYPQGSASDGIWPHANAYYISRQYKGVVVHWRFHAMHIARWQQVKPKIDAQLRARNVLEP